VAALDVEEQQVLDTTVKLQNVIAAARSNLSDTESQELEELLTKYRDISAMKSDDYRYTNIVYHRTDMGEALLICQPPRKLSLAKQADVGEMLKDMQMTWGYQGVIQPWLSSCSRPEERGPSLLHRLQETERGHKERLFPIALE
jgi:hypothetical protein